MDRRKAQKGSEYEKYTRGERQKTKSIRKKIASERTHDRMQADEIRGGCQDRAS